MSLGSVKYLYANWEKALASVPYLTFILLRWYLIFSEVFSEDFYKIDLLQEIGFNFEEDIKKIIKSSKGLVVIDEAYADYSSHSYLPMLKRNSNLLIMKTMSKVGFASLRLGYLIGNSKIISEINKIRLPYNISTLSQLIACDYFDNQKSIKKILML